MMRFLVAAAGLFLMFVPGATALQTVGDDVTVAVEAASGSVTLGGHLDIAVVVTNTGTDPSASLVAHIDITDPGRSGSVDPEDWTGTLSKPVGVLRPGQTETVPWRIQPISAGTYSLYAVALAEGDTTVAASNVLEISVDDRRSLDPNGILPVAIGTPLLVGGLLAVQLRVNRRTRRAPDNRVRRARPRSTHTGTA